MSVYAEGIRKALKGERGYVLWGEEGVLTHGTEDSPALLLFTDRDLAAKMAAHPLAGAPIVQERDAESLAALMNQFGIRDLVLDPETA